MSSDPHLRGEYAFVSSDESRFGFGFEIKKLITIPLSSITIEGL
jgi:hypothetical protein